MKNIVIKTKVCFKCNEDKVLTSFYKHSGNKDGHLNKCKECTKLDSRNAHEEKSKDIEWVKKERVRGRDKYHRLGYKDKQKEWDKDKPWKKESTYKRLSKIFKTDKGTELHHWNYNKSSLIDVFAMDIKQHRQGHKYLELDIDKKMFRDLQGNLLDTKEKHFKYLQDLGIRFISYQPTLFRL
tara:strand:- start:30 stop:575 length:546 start_codon:yes stop_codon:yes gene_type:complete